MRNILILITLISGLIFASLIKNKNPSRYFPKLDKEDTRLFDCPIRKSIKPSEKEILINHPSRSAKLRYGIRNNKKYFFPNKLTEKFKNYLEIEGMGSHLWETF